MTTVILASKSPRRRELLDLIGVPHTVVPSGAPEDSTPGESPEKRVSGLAEKKARWVAASLDDDALIIGADTLVFFHGRALGQPRDEAEAASMLTLLSGTTHVVCTGLCLMRPGYEAAVETSRSLVTFHRISREEIAWYTATGEPTDKAGAYGAQGLGAIFIKSIEGSYHNVVGFPIDIFYHLLPAVGLSLRELRGR